MSGFFESFSLMAIFLLIGGFGFLFLLVSFFFGDIFEALGLDFGTDLDGSHDFGLFDSRVISIFLTAFGASGAIGTAFGHGAAGSLLFALLGGFVLGAVVFYFGKLLYNQQSSSSVSAADLIGRTAQVVVNIKPGQLGQISCRIGDERVEKLARTEGGEEIKAGQIVRIDSIGSDSVVVSVESNERISLFSENA